MDVKRFMGCKQIILGCGDNTCMFIVYYFLKNLINFTQNLPTILGYVQLESALFSFLCFHF